MLISSCKQLSFRDISSEFDTLADSDNCNLVSLLSEFFDIQEFIPFSFYQAYYSSSGRKRAFPLEAMLNAFIIKNILSLPTIDLLISFLHISKELRIFCGFNSVPNKSQFSRFKSTFNSELDNLFHSFVDKLKLLLTKSIHFLLLF